MEMKSIWTKESEVNLEKIRNWLLDGFKVHVINAYETFYGCEFDGWLRKGLSDLNVDIVGDDWNYRDGYWWSYDIVLK